MVDTVKETLYWLIQEINPRVKPAVDDSPDIAQRKALGTQLLNEVKALKNDPGATKDQIASFFQKNIGKFSIFHDSVSEGLKARLHANGININSTNNKDKEPTPSLGQQANEVIDQLPVAAQGGVKAVKNLGTGLFDSAVEGGSTLFGGLNQMSPSSQKSLGTLAAIAGLFFFWKPINDATKGIPNILLWAGIIGFAVKAFTEHSHDQHKEHANVNHLSPAAARQ